MTHIYSLYIIASGTCDCCNAEITEVCGDCQGTVCEPCHDHYTEDSAA